MNMSLFTSTLFTSLSICVLIVFTQPLHGRLTLDHLPGVQMLHGKPVPRIGGVGLFLGLLAAWGLAPDSLGSLLAPLLVAGLPALGAGLLEDITKLIGVRVRLLATMVSGVLICLLTGASLDHLDIPLIDPLFALSPVAVLFTAFALAGIANAINIIDGVNGLASGVLVCCSAAIGLVAAGVGDTELAWTAALLAAASAGFWLVNFPFGKLFLGDGGAYFGGFALAWLAVLLPMRNPDVSPWVGLLVCAYPVIETLYTILRRLRSHQSPGAPDAAHLHSLVMSCLVARRAPGWPAWAQHSLVSLPLWGLAAAPAALAIWLALEPAQNLALAFAGMFVAYHLIYRLVLCRQKARPASPLRQDPRQEHLHAPR
ncbi:glycosyltransferase [Hydrogenophaga sp.]|uniref:MraY family glycosyltransferase n=1 Tax=Hydrogenophaga sp. TaxID=1904254 RepID=UPI00286E560D|nr:glycosyltransferase [Hydrogenophaga sp.]